MQAPTRVRAARNAGGARSVLLLAGLTVVVLLLVVGWTAGRAAAREGETGAGTAGAESASARAELESPARIAADVSAERRLPQESTQAEAPALPERASLAGTLRVDGEAPWRTAIHAVSEDGAWEARATADSDGRFVLDDVPAVPLRLELVAEPGRMEAFEGRVLLLPVVSVTPAAGAREPLVLDWTSRHVNVLVVDDEPLVTPARVELEGPSYATQFVTGENGRARLALIGSGTFVFRAELPSGRRGEVEVELGEDEELDTVVVSTGSRARSE